MVQPICSRLRAGPVWQPRSRLRGYGLVSVLLALGLAALFGWLAVDMYVTTVTRD